MARDSKNLNFKTFNSISDLKTVLGEFYMHERLPKRKLRRLERFLTSKLAEKLWNSNAEKFYPNSYVILSAKYGFLFPDELIPENYTVTFKDPNTKPISVGELKRHAIEKDLLKYDEIVVIAGKDYVEIVKKVFQNKVIRTPLKGLKSMGLMISAMNKAIKEGKEL